MRVALMFVAMLSLFLAGVMWTSSAASSVALLSGGMILAGLMYAAAETHGFEGRYVAPKTPPYRWETLYMDLMRLALNRNAALGKEGVYVLLGTGVTPINGVFSARVNGEMSFVLDTSEPVPMVSWNAIKQGVM